MSIFSNDFFLNDNYFKNLLKQSSEHVSYFGIDSNLQLDRW